MRRTRRTAAVTALEALTLAFGLSFAGSASAVATPKKGVGTWSFGGEAQAMSAAGATWFYTWSTSSSGNSAPSTASFVPMIWGSASVTSGNLSQVKTESTVLLGFNEPDQSGQSNLTPAQAIALWPQLVATGMRLGSPAVSANAQMAGGWLDQFMTSAASMNLRVDFICLHWYGGNFNPTMAVSELESYVEQTHAKYNLPIWVTEFALTSFSGGVSYPTETQQAEFAAGAVDMLESTSYVERYAWFALPPCDATGSSSCDAGNTRPLSVDGGALTDVGIAYAGAGPDGGTESVEGGASSSGGGSSGDGGSAAGDAGSGPAGSMDATVSGDATVTEPGDGATGVPANGDDAAAGHGGSGSSGGCNCTLAGHGGSETPSSAALLGAAAALAFTGARRARGSDRRRAWRRP